MKKFLIIFEQVGEGCGYSIGCGTSIHEIKAESKEEAFTKGMTALDWVDPENYADDDPPWEGDLEISSVVVYEIADEDANLFENYRIAFENQMKTLSKKDEELKERNELMRLAAKYDMRLTTIESN